MPNKPTEKVHCKGCGGWVAEVEPRTGVIVRERWPRRPVGSIRRLMDNLRHRWADHDRSEDRTVVPGVHEVRLTEDGYEVVGELELPLSTYEELQGMADRLKRSPQWEGLDREVPHPDRAAVTEGAQHAFCRKCNLHWVWGRGPRRHS